MVVLFGTYMLEIESVTLRNFLSYGDYDTHLPISNLGACLITGTVRNGATTYETPSSNGSGKSAFALFVAQLLAGGDYSAK